MQLQQFVQSVQNQLVAAAALGDERTKHIAETLAASSDPAVRLALLGAVSAASDEINAALVDLAGSLSVAVRMDADDLHVDVQTSSADDDDAVHVPIPDGADATARISLRLGDALKADIENAAKSESISVNTWLLRAAAHALHHNDSGGRDNRGSGRVQKNPHHITGWINS